MRSVIDADAVLEENKRRIRLRGMPYNPYKGEGSPIARKKFFLDEESAMWLPVRAFDDPLKYKELCVQAGNRLSSSGKRDYPGADSV